MSHSTKGLHSHNDPLIKPEGHAGLALLDEYHAGHLTSPEEEQVRQHLVLCRKCQELLLDWAAFQETAGTSSRLWSAELTSAWEEWLDLKEHGSAPEDGSHAQLTEITHFD